MEALKNEEHKVSLQVFRMILCGIARVGKTTFWKRLTKLEGFRTSDISPSTSAFESQMLSANERKDSNINEQTKPKAQNSNSKSNSRLEQESREASKVKESTSPHLESAMLFDFHVYSKSDTLDLKKEALTIYKHILMTKDPKSVSDLTGTKTISKSHSEAQINTADDAASVSVSDKAPSPALLPDVKESDPISEEINNYFKELEPLLKSGEKLPDIPLIKKLCSLADIGGQRAFLEMLPTVTIGKALYLIFFSYENFEDEYVETVQKEANPKEMPTGTRYKQMDVIMQSLICVSTTSQTSSDNVALLVGTHVDKVEPEYVDHVNRLIRKNDIVKSCINSQTLVYAQEDELVLEVSIESVIGKSTHDPEHYQKVIMKLVDSDRLKCSESEKLPASWYMFSIVLRQLQLAGHSVIQYSHCQQIASKLHIKETQLHGLLSRMHKILGIVIYFPEVKQLKDTVICDPAIVYDGISKLIFNSFDKQFHRQRFFQLKKLGVFMVKELKEHCKKQKGCPLQVDKLMILLQHLGIIAPTNVIKSAEADVPSLKFEHQDDTEHTIHPEYLIPCILDDAMPVDLKVDIQEAQACCIVPLRVYFSCGFAPMGGFCYLFTKLISNYRDNGWELLQPDKVCEETSKNIYWRNKVTFQVDEKYIVTLLSTHEYYEIHIVYTQSTKAFKLGSDGHRICKKVWNAVSNVLLKSLNEPLRHYKTACECTMHQGNKDYDGHMMIFSHNPDEHNHKLQVTASCLQNKTRRETLNDEQQSIIVWFKVCLFIAKLLTRWLSEFVSDYHVNYAGTMHLSDKALW